MNAVVMDGAEIGDDSLVGALSFVRAGSIIAPRSLVVGSPASARPLDTDTLAWKNNGHGVYRDLTRRCREGFREIEPLTHAEPNRPRVSTGPDVSRPLHEIRRDDP